MLPKNNVGQAVGQILPGLKGETGKKRVAGPKQVQMQQGKHKISRLENNLSSDTLPARPTGIWK